MMLRDQFAMAAISAIISTGVRDPEIVSKIAYKQADAMMRERAKQDFSGDPDAAKMINGVVVSADDCPCQPPRKP